jgi:hypothetical protein
MGCNIHPLQIFWKCGVQEQSMTEVLVSYVLEDFETTLKS